MTFAEDSHTKQPFLTTSFTSTAASPEVCRQAFLVTDRTPDTWLAYHDLNNLAERGGDLWSDLNISLSKNDSIPSVHGGILWGDSVNKRFYLFGGEWNNGFSQGTYSLLSYDIIYDKWDHFGTPDITPLPKIASYGAGVGISETGMGYYLGGWISNASMSGWTGDRTMSSNFYTNSYDSGKLRQVASLS
ncbi:uncharacterized protein FTJAE_634 [Fusarium tjaetaba]|uniref:Uncharacterized protein n=1 Tax=Fusarium tjaetaba TaxID=1567544 RepID=A0A8H5W9F2_9HYPO|nr:uncharacterized protein FTJAE_634 [Fusarium tjaetaba]KAF5650210.1 hypothetical protein FTJAE_634 [Fusarium tjaetaba]